MICYEMLTHFKHHTHTCPGVRCQRGQVSLSLKVTGIEGSILSRKLFVDPEEFLAFVHYADETAEAGVFGFEPDVEVAHEHDSI